MDIKEYQTIQARMAYKLYLETLPKCDKCEQCMFVSDRSKDKRVCLKKRELVDCRVKTSPEWCPKREGNK